MEITLFRGARDTAPDNFEVTWSELCEFVPGFMAIQRKRSEKLDHDALIFGRCEGRRAKSNARFLSGLAADFDTAPDAPGYVTFAATCDRLEREGFAFIAYTTTANEARHNRFRLVMPYAHDVPFELCQPAWHACNEKFGGAIDASTKDESRLSFLPADWTENPFSDPSKGAVTLAEPFNAVRLSMTGKPVLSAAEIASLSLSVGISEQRRCSAPPVFVDALREPERRSLAHGKGANDPAWMLLASLSHSPLVKPWMLEQLPFEKGQRDYRFMTAAAGNAIRANIPITADVVETLAEQFSRERLHREPPRDVARQAENALAWAFRTSAGVAGPNLPDAAT